MRTVEGRDSAAVVERLCRASNDHDLEAIVACFSANYRAEAPAHPARSFTGREQVRQNWTRILAAVPDVTTEVRLCTVDGNTVWTEWEHRGTRRDGTLHVMRGVIIFGVEDDTIDWARLYLEPVDQDEATVDLAIRAQVGVR